MASNTPRSLTCGPAVLHVRSDLLASCAAGSVRGVRPGSSGRWGLWQRCVSLARETRQRPWLSVAGNGPQCGPSAQRQLGRAALARLAELLAELRSIFVRPCHRGGNHDGLAADDLGNEKPTQLARGPRHNEVASLNLALRTFVVHKSAESDSDFLLRGCGGHVTNNDRRRKVCQVL